MAQSINTGSTLDWDNGNNKTSTAVATNIIIQVNGQAVGAIQQLQVKEARQVKQINEIGTDGHVDSVPIKSTDISGSCQRVRFDRLRITEAFYRGFLHISAQIYPFDIVVLDKQKQGSATWVSTVIKNVWITSLDYTLNAENWIITETMGWEAESISSIIAGGQSAALGGERQLISLPSTSSAGLIERAVDTGAAGRRGSLDAGGLIDIGSSGNLF